MQDRAVRASESTCALSVMDFSGTRGAIYPCDAEYAVICAPFPPDPCFGDYSCDNEGRCENLWNEIARKNGSCPIFGSDLARIRVSALTLSGGM